jgi:hypothetical protein
MTRTWVEEPLPRELLLPAGSNFPPVILAANQLVLVSEPLYQNSFRGSPMAANKVFNPRGFWASRQNAAMRFSFDQRKLAGRERVSIP